MPKTVQSLLAASLQKTSADLFAALLRLPEDKRNWSPGGTARTALDIVAECALNNRYVADFVETRQWSTFDPEAYNRQKADLASSGLEPLKSVLEENTKHLIDIVNAVPDDSLDVVVASPFGDGPLTRFMTYPYWNMSYHEGQLNYLETILGL